MMPIYWSISKGHCKTVRLDSDRLFSAAFLHAQTLGSPSFTNLFRIRYQRSINLYSITVFQALIRANGLAEDTDITALFIDLWKIPIYIRLNYRFSGAATDLHLLL